MVSVTSYAKADVGFDSGARLHRLLFALARKLFQRKRCGQCQVIRSFDDEGAHFGGRQSGREQDMVEDDSRPRDP